MIDLETARDIAYAWHGGGGSPLYSFASTSNDGQPRNISPETVAEVDDCIASYVHTDFTLSRLRQYLLANLPPEEEPEETMPNTNDYGYSGLVGSRYGYRTPPGYVHEQDE